MAIAAVPDYLGTAFSTASPGMRFGICLKLWGVDYTIEKNTKTCAINAATHLNPDDQGVLKALTQRQRTLFPHAQRINAGCAMSLSANSIAPFTTGLGNEHPLENGFAFMNPYGLPYLPGSGVKGVVRRAAQELACGMWGESHGWTKCCDYTFRVSKEKTLRLSMIDVLFGREPPTGDKHHIRGALTFWDVIPQIKGERLSVEIMTPHQSHYYQKCESPHDSGQPNPISFLTVPPGSAFTFHVACDPTHLARFAPDLAKDDRWQDLLRAAFCHAFEWLGFGAKTAVGYGAMEVDRRAEEAARKRAVEEAARRAQEDARRRETEAVQAEDARRQEETARRQAARDALPESRRLMLEAEEALQRWRQSSKQDRRYRQQLDAALKKVTEQAPSWPDNDEREAAARLLENTYDEIGWHRGKNKKQRENQKRKKRNAIARIRAARSQ